MQSIINLEPDPPFWTKTSWLQMFYGVWVNLTLVCIGLAFGFPAVAIPQLVDSESSIVMTVNDEALIASVLTLSAPIGSLICGMIMDRYGRKIALILLQVPMTIGWFYAGCAARAHDIVIGRIISGVGVGMAMSAPRAYISEITLPNMRGVIGALPNLATSIGLSVQAILGLFLRWDYLCFSCGIYSLLMGLMNLFLPDSPYYKILTASASTARNALRKFRSSKFNVDAELNELNDFKTVNNIHMLTIVEQVKQLFKPSSCKPFGIVLGYVVLMQGVGVNVVVMWAPEMLETAQSTLDPNMGNFVLALARIVFGVMTSILLYRVGRRPLALTSAIGLGLVSLLLGGFLHTNDEPTIYPQIFLTGYIAFATLGYYTLPFLIMFEILPLQVRGILSGVIITILNISMFGLNHCYPSMRRAMGLANIFLMYGAISLLGAIFLYFTLPETKGLTLPEIEEYFNFRRPTLVSQRQVMSMQMQGFSRSNEPKSNSYNIKDSSSKEFKKQKRLQKKERSLEKANKKDDTNTRRKHDKRKRRDELRAQTDQIDETDIQREESLVKIDESIKQTSQISEQKAEYSKQTDDISEKKAEYSKQIDDISEQKGEYSKQISESSKQADDKKKDESVEDDASNAKSAKHRKPRGSVVFKDDNDSKDPGDAKM